ncbi:hypothetical protein [Flavobacterium sp. 9AF]|uniref:hypothetical protein n=1 Tax=Flavobacterium sp. 9AF TaxID=2653142 RepID=UPI00135740C0|nr:hypothetical protein [Flavobacterium sp. 9AF]
MSLIKELPAISISDICKQLTNFSKTTVDSSGLPSLELLLHNGTFIIGKIVDFQENSGKQYIWIENNIDFPEKTSVLFLEVNQIIGINIVDFESYLRYKELSKPAEIIGALELKRTKKSTEELIEDLLGKTITINLDIDNLMEEERAVIYKGLHLITTVFQQILSEEINKLIISQNLSTIDLTISDSLEVTLNKELLSISLQNKTFETTVNQIKILKEKIESIF